MDALAYYGFIAALFAVSVILGMALGPVIVRILEFFSGKTKSTLDDRIIAAVKRPLESFFFLIIFYFLLHYFQGLESAAKLLDAYTYAILVVIATYMLSEASGAAIRWYYEEGYREARHVKLDLSLLPFLRKVTNIAIYVIGFTVALSAAGFDVTGLLAVTSVVGLILGLASQETLANLFAGLALQLDRPYHYGDYLRLPGGEIATVKKIGMRTTKLEDLNHNTIIISNSEFAKLRVTNLSLPDDLSIVSVPIELANSADLSQLKKSIVAELSRSKPNGLLADRGYELVISSVKPSTITVSFTFWVKGYASTQRITDIVNRAALEFVKKKK